jgi:hypothetical protein
MPKPQPEQFDTFGRYVWAKHLWRRRTGGSLLGTAAMAIGFGALTGRASVLIFLLVFGLLLHLYIRHTRQ